MCLILPAFKTKCNKNKTSPFPASSSSSCLILFSSPSSPWRTLPVCTLPSLPQLLFTLQLSLIWLWAPWHKTILSKITSDVRDIISNRHCSALIFLDLSETCEILVYMTPDSLDSPHTLPHNSKPTLTRACPLRSSNLGSDIPSLLSLPSQHSNLINWHGFKYFCVLSISEWISP